MPASAFDAAGSAAQAIKSLEMRIEALTRASEDLAQQLEKAAEGGDAQASFNLSSTLNNIEQERRQLLAEKARLEGKPKEEDDSRPQRGLNRLFYNGGYAQNNARAAALIGTGRDMAAGTGFDLYGFLRLATNYASHGAKTQSEAIADTRQAALFANRTGASRRAWRRRRRTSFFLR